MDMIQPLGPNQLLVFLRAIAPVRPVFIWGAPGIGKSSLVQQFAGELGMACVALLGSQLAPEDLIGVPTIEQGASVFCPPRMIQRREPYVLFLDELNASSVDVQRAFYSLILEQRVGEFVLPKGSIIIGAGNREIDKGLTRPLPGPLVNRLVHVGLEVPIQDWLLWAEGAGIHPAIKSFLKTGPKALVSPANQETPFSTPRAWHSLSDGLWRLSPQLDEEVIRTLAMGLLSPSHVGPFRSHLALWKSKIRLDDILDGATPWPGENKSSEVRHALGMELRGRLKKVGKKDEALSPKDQIFLKKATQALKDLQEVDQELAQAVSAPFKGSTLLDGYVAAFLSTEVTHA